VIRYLGDGGGWRGGLGEGMLRLGELRGVGGVGKKVAVKGGSGRIEGVGGMGWVRLKMGLMEGEFFSAFAGPEVTVRDEGVIIREECRRRKNVVGIKVVGEQHCAKSWGGSPRKYCFIT